MTARAWVFILEREGLIFGLPGMLRVCLNPRKRKNEHFHLTLPGSGGPWNTSPSNLSTAIAL